MRPCLVKASVCTIVGPTYHWVPRPLQIRVATSMTKAFKSPVSITVSVARLARWWWVVCVARWPVVSCFGRRGRNALNSFVEYEKWTQGIIELGDIMDSVGHIHTKWALVAPYILATREVWYQLKTLPNEQKKRISILLRSHNNLCINIEQ